jgi:hypothetical protein
MSYLARGRIARVSTNRYAEIATLIPNQASQGRKPQPSEPEPQGEPHPPKNKDTHKADIKSMFEYSPRKNRAKVMEEYSRL